MKSLRHSILLTALALIATPCLMAAAEHDAIKPVPRQGGWMTRHQSFNKRVAQGNVDLVFIGDSITQGWEGGGKGVWSLSSPAARDLRRQFIGVDGDAFRGPVCRHTGRRGGRLGLQ